MKGAMKGTVRVLAIAGLLVLQQALGTLPFLQAQVDPCKPVPIPGLCEDPSPSPSPSPGGGGGGKGGGGGGGSGGGGGQTGGGKTGGGQDAAPRADDARDDDHDSVEAVPFSLGGPKNTARLVEILTGLTRYGISLRESILEVVGPFPVAGLAWWTNDWHACRDGCSRQHKGLDIFAEIGTPLVATAHAVVTAVGTGALAGLYVKIRDDEGTEYFYAHLDDWAEGLKVGQRVEMGEVIGYVGNTGNAIHTPPHVHFEYQPDGIAAPPKPLVDGWLKIAERRALQLVQEHAGDEPISLEDIDAFRLSRLFDLAGTGTGLDEGSARLLLLAGLQPAASSLEVTRRTIDQMAWEIDWRAQIEAQLERLTEGLEHATHHGESVDPPLFSSPDGANLGD